MFHFCILCNNLKIRLELMCFPIRAALGTFGESLIYTVFCLQDYGMPQQYGVGYNQQPYAMGQQYPAQPGTVMVQPTVFVAPQPLEKPVNDYLGYSIFTMICCCLPLGIAALIYSITVSSLVLYFALTLEDASYKVQLNCFIYTLVLARPFCVKCQFPLHWINKFLFQQK